jgi:hypothetical protein
MCAAGDAAARLKRWKKNRLVKMLIRDSRPTATYALMIPIGMATSVVLRRARPEGEHDFSPYQPDPARTVEC